MVHDSLKKDKEMGSIDTGKLADLVFLDRNPLDNIDAVTHVSGVYSRGRYLGRPDLDKILADIKDAKIKLDKIERKIKTLVGMGHAVISIDSCCLHKQYSFHL
jgi:hypothetical protein